MSKFPILDSILKPRQQEDCDKPNEFSIINPPTSKFAGKEYRLEFPTGIESNTIPMAGGAVISIPIGGLELSKDSSGAINDIITSSVPGAVAKLNLNYSLDSLSEFHTEINKQLFEISKKKFRIIKNGISAPNIYFSLFNGNPGEVEQGVFVTDMFKICEFKYIPFEFFSKALENIKSLTQEQINNSQKNFRNVVGISGRSFDDLCKLFEKDSSVSTSLTDQNIADLVLEFFPILNISEEQILSAKSTQSQTPIQGGYYTIENDRFFFKMPDLSGRNSAQESTVYFDEDRLFFEVLSNAVATRIEILNYKFPPVASFTVDQSAEFPAVGENLVIKFSATNLGDSGYKLYLSPIINSDDLVLDKKAKYITEYSSEIELFSHPVLTKPIESGRSSIVSLDNYANKGYNVYYNTAYDFLYEKLKNYVPKGKYSILDSKVELSDLLFGLDLPNDTFIKCSRDKVFGIKNRPEILLAQDGMIDIRNDEKYHSLSSYGKVSILASKYPKFYLNTISDFLISSGPKEDLDFDDGLSFISEIPYEEFDGINPGREISFAAYVADSFGQISKVSGPPITLSYPNPSIISTVPTGYNDSGIIWALSSDPIKLTIEAVGFDSNCSLVFATADGITKTISLKNEIVSISNDNKLITVNFPILYLFSDLAINRSQVVRVYLTCNGSISDLNYKTIYVSYGENDSRPPEPSGPDAPIYISLDEFSKTNGGKPIVAIPLFKDGVSEAEIEINSLNRIFERNANIYAYIGLPDSNIASKNILSHFSFPDDIYEAQTKSGKILIPANIFFQLGNSSASDFYSVSRSKAKLKIPGSKYKDYNFSSLEWVDKAYIIITNKRIDALSPDERLSSDYNSINFDSYSAGIFSYGIINLGDDNDCAFIPPYNILDFAIKDSQTDIQSTFEKTAYDADVFTKLLNGNGSEIFNNKNPIQVKKSIEYLFLIVSGTTNFNEKNINDRYDIFINEEKITKKNIYQKPIKIGKSKILLSFKDIVPNAIGNLAIHLERRGPGFIQKYVSKGIYSQATAVIRLSDFGENKNYEASEGEFILFKDIQNKIISNLKDYIDSENKTIDSINQEIGREFNYSGFIGPEGTVSVIDTLYRDGSGVIFNKSKTDDFKNTYYPIKIRPSNNISLKINNEDKVIPQLYIEQNVNTIGKSTLSIPSESIFILGQQVVLQEYFIPDRSSSYALLFINTYNEGFATFGYNLAQVISITRLNGPTVTPCEIVAGETYLIEVSGSEDNFDIIINGIQITPRVIERRGENYIATIVMPNEVVGLEVVTISACASNKNSDLNNAIDKIGETVKEVIEDFDRFKEGLPDLEKIQEIIDRIPLTLVGIDLGLPAPARQVAKSICDFSFDLLKELNFALKNFRVLMIPVQVIFAIIDVICALLNPAKLVKAILRLYQSLYDLVCLIPPLSVPSMFLDTLIHSLELIKCVFDKLLLSIRSIDYLIQDLKFAGRSPFTVRSVKEIEQTIEEFLNDIELDIKFLDPLISIFAIFLDLLQMIFRFPCPVDLDGGLDCGIEGTMLGGLVAGVASLDSEIVPEVMVPVSQFYTTSSTGSTASPVEYNVGDVVASNTSETFYESMNIDSDSLRAESTFDFNPTLAPTFTKTKKSGNKSGKVEFIFSYRGKTTSLRKVNIDPNQTIDSPLGFFSQSGSELVVSGLGGLFSPIDGFAFLEVDLDRKQASVKPLVITYEIPVTNLNPATGELVQIGVETTSRTFDNIPSLAVLDDELNLYFIERDGIKYNNDGFVDLIKAKIVNDKSAPKHKFSKEEVETEDGDEINLYDFPQLYFFDMRTISNQLQQFCVTSSINSLPLEEDNTDDIIDIVGTAQLCFKDWQSSIKNYISQIRNRTPETLESLPTLESSGIESGNQTLEKCVQESIDNICRYVVSSLNTSFKVLEDNDFTPNKEYVDGDISPALMDGFQSVPPAFTGAREYAAGIGDNAILNINQIANIEVIPRTIFDRVMNGDLTDKISLEIINDETGDAKIIINEDQTIFTKVNGSYVARLTSGKPGEVRVKATVCDRTIQALTYQGTSIGEDPSSSSDNCVPASPNIPDQNSSTINILTKVDRILSIYFRNKSNNSLSITNLADNYIITDPQQFGTSLEN